MTLLSIQGQKYVENLSVQMQVCNLMLDLCLLRIKEFNQCMLSNCKLYHSILPFLIGDKQAKKECKKEKLREYCQQGDNINSIQCKRVECQEIEDKKDRKKCIRDQMADYCNSEANSDTLTCRMMGIKEAKRMCVQKTVEEFCEDEQNSKTRVCKRLQDKNESED